MAALGIAAAVGRRARAVSSSSPKWNQLCLGWATLTGVTLARLSIIWLSCDRLEARIRRTRQPLHVGRLHAVGRAGGMFDGAEMRDVDVGAAVGAALQARAIAIAQAGVRQVVDHVGQDVADAVARQLVWLSFQSVSSMPVLGSSTVSVKPCVCQ